MLTIRKTNALDKLSFVLRYAVGDDGQVNLQNLLFEYLKSRGDNILSRQTIMYWFAKNSTPSRAPAFIFLKEFLEERVNYTELDEEQKKVYHQLVDFFSNSLKSLGRDAPSDFSSEHVLVSAANNIVFENYSSAVDVEETLASWAGTYISYRMRLIESEDYCISREVVRIFKRKREIRFQHWHLKEGSQIAKFDGVVCIKRHQLWMFGVSSTNDRFRICHFRREDGRSDRINKFRWGLMHSEIPLGSSREPCSTRIFWVKQEVGISSITKFIEDRVRYISIEEMESEQGKGTSRFVNNAYSAFSERNSIEPEAQSDHFLQTDQKTIETHAYRAS